MQEGYVMKKNFIDELSIILTEKKLIKPEELVGLHKSFKQKTNLSFEEFLLEEGIVEKSDLLDALSQYYQVPAIDISGDFLDHHNTRLIPKDVMLRHYFVPYERDEHDNLWVVAANPSDPHLRTVIGEYISHHIDFMVGIAQDIIDAVQEAYDQSITWEPQEVQNQQMERSQIDVHPGQDLLRPEDSNVDIPVDWQDNIDDYEKD